MIRIALTTFETEDDARRTVRRLVGENLIACGTIIPGANSIYQWQGNIEENGEVLVLLKTSAENLAALEARLLEIHPYETPEFLVLAVGHAAAAYAEWLLAACARK